MRFRLKTAQELLNEFGVDWMHIYPTINPEMMRYLGDTITDEYANSIINTYRRPDGTFASFEFSYKGWSWSNKVITLNIPNGKRLFHPKISSIISKGRDIISDMLKDYIYTQRELEHIKEINILENGVATYTPEGKETALSEEGHILKKGRQQSKIGRLFGKILSEFNIEYSDKELEDFVNYIKGATSGDVFEMIEGERIKEVYDYHSHSRVKDVGNLNSSCMRHERCQEYFGIYIDNPDICKMLILKDSFGDIVGRALVWKTDKGMFMDRAYGTDATISKFLDYAKRNDWMVKARQSAECKIEIVTPDGTTKRLDMKVELSKPLSDYDYVPYLDTFSYATTEKLLCNNSKKCDYGILDTTEGYIKRMFRCCITNGLYITDYRQTDTVDGETVEFMYDEGYSCVHDGNVYHPDNMVHTSRGYVNKSLYGTLLVDLGGKSGWQYKEDCFTCDYDNNLYHKIIENDYYDKEAFISFTLDDRLYTVHINNASAFAKDKGAIYKDGTFISKSLSLTLEN